MPKGSKSVPSSSPCSFGTLQGCRLKLAANGFPAADVQVFFDLASPIFTDALSPLPFSCNLLTCYWLGFLPAGLDTPDEQEISINSFSSPPEFLQCSLGAFCGRSSARSLPRAPQKKTREKRSGMRLDQELLAAAEESFQVLFSCRSCKPCPRSVISEDPRESLLFFSLADCLRSVFLERVVADILIPYQLPMI